MNTPLTTPSTTPFKLYYSPGTCSLAVHIVLRESASPFTLHQVDLATHRTADGVDLYSLSPKGQVPLLEMADGSRLTEGPVICQFIADSAQASTLMPPASSMARYRVMEWQNYITAELHKSYTPLFQDGLDASAKSLLAGRLHKKLQWVDQQLEGRQHLTGEAFTAADAYLFVVLRWSAFVQVDITQLTQLNAFMARVAKRPAVQAALQAEGLTA